MNLDNKAEMCNLIFDELSFLFWKDKSGIYRGCNQNQAKAFGFKSPKEFIGKNIYEIIEDHVAAKKIDEFDRQLMENKTISIVEEPIKTRNGIKTYLSRKSPIYDNENNVIGLLGTAVDITEYALIKEQKELMEKQKIELEQKQLELEIKNFKEIEVKDKKFRNLIDQIYRNQHALITQFMNDDINELPRMKINLTIWESQILFAIYNKKNAKATAEYLSSKLNKEVNYEAVNAMINKRLYKKFNVYSQDKLFEKALILKLIPLFFPE